MALKKRIKTGTDLGIPRIKTNTMAVTSCIASRFYPMLLTSNKKKLTKNMVGENMTLLSLSEALIYLINVQKSKLEKFYLKILSLSKKLSKKTFLKNMYIKTHGRL